MGKRSISTSRRYTELPSSVQEDPFEDMRYLNLSRADSMFVITSAGDNALHYAIEANPKQVGHRAYPS